MNSHSFVQFTLHTMRVSVVWVYSIISGTVSSSGKLPSGVNFEHRAMTAIKSHGRLTTGHSLTPLFLSSRRLTDQPKFRKEHFCFWASQAFLCFRAPGWFLSALLLVKIGFSQYKKGEATEPYIVLPDLNSNFLPWITCKSLALW